jgi:catechol 2,3-dioxygenase-like lactoylglutathione lyase family enzyme
LRSSLAEQGIEVTHSRALEMVATQLGFRDWNTLAAEIGRDAGTEAISFSLAIPILRILSEEKAREFYIDFLGFTVDWEHRFEPGLPLYMQIHRSNLILHLSEHHGDGIPGSSVFLDMNGIADFHAELAAKGYKHARPGLEQEAYGITLTVGDGFGNGLRFCERSGE